MIRRWARRELRVEVFPWRGRDRTTEHRTHLRAELREGGGVKPLYLLAHVALRLRNAGTVNVERLVVAIVLLALLPVAVSISAVWSLAVVNVLLWSMITFETFRVYDDRRFQLRHDLDADIPSRGDRSEQ